MIVVTKATDRITIKGHAGYAEPGKDIICAGVSTLAQTLIKSIEDLTEDKITYSMSPGTVDIKLWNLSEQTKALIGSFFIGIKLIADEYPQYVCISPKH